MPKRKTYIAESKAVDVDQGIYEAVITTRSIDRDGDVIESSGAKVDNYLKNPVVMYAHDYGGFPVGKAMALEMTEDNIKARWQFAPADVNPEAEMVRRLWDGGYLNAVSIGFNPAKWEKLEAENEEASPWGGYRFTEWELLEFSIVPVPANQEALRLAVKGLDAPTVNLLDLDAPKTTDTVTIGVATEDGPETVQARAAEPEPETPPAPDDEPLADMDAPTELPQDVIDALKVAIVYLAKEIQQ